MVELVGTLSVGDELHLTIYRQGETMEVTVIIEEQIHSALANEEIQQNQQSKQGSQSGFPWGSDGFGRP